MIPVILALTSITSGCRSVQVEFFDKKNPDKVIKYKYTNFGFDTKFGHLDVTTPEGGRVIIDDLDASSQAIQVAGQAIQTVNAVVNKVP